MRKLLKVVTRVMIDLFVIIVVILSYLIWQNSENKQYEEYLDSIQKIGGLKIDDINSIVIKEGMIYQPETIILNREHDKYKFAFVLHELSWILKRTPDLIDLIDNESSIRILPDYTITLKSKEGTSVREFEVYHIQLIDVKNRASYTFYMGYCIKEWLKEILFEPATDSKTPNEPDKTK
ncbi:MAG: hypothetical protein QME51_10685 [Planctomycetota bacterium]|nr:hypothetical protein [Planctomycetota bacterium]MDI6788826.1 hypothetical protein [Planctomycetota bacterium]